MARHTFFCVDAHTCGNPVRVVSGGAPLLRAGTMAAKRAEFQENHDWIRKALMFEPRGHDVMSGTILYTPSTEDYDLGILFIEVSGCLPMCGHGTIGTVTVVLEQGLVTPKTPGVLNLEVPAGHVIAEYAMNENGKVEWVKLTNVPSFLALESETVSVPGLGEIVFDVSYGGNFYAIIEPQANFAGLENVSADFVLRASPEVRRAINEKFSVIHPENPAISKVSHVLWTGKPSKPGLSARNAVFYGDKAIDRSPCGTGTSARMAQLFAKGKLRIGEDFIHESIIGSLFTGRVEKEVSVAGKPAIIPSVAGWAQVTGLNTIFVDDRDPYAHGFQVK